jgi:hypothetical protein
MFSFNYHHKERTYQPIHLPFCHTDKVLEKLTVAQHVKNFFVLKKIEGFSSVCSQYSTTDPHPQRDDSCPRPPALFFKDTLQYHCPIYTVPILAPVRYRGNIKVQPVRMKILVYLILCHLTLGLQGAPCIT